MHSFFIFIVTTFSAILQTTSVTDGAPIQVMPKPKRRKRSQNVFHDNRGYPDQSDEFDKLLNTIDGGTILRKRTHPAPALDALDPAFAETYVEASVYAKS